MRNLAQRSAEAAKEIKSLIKDSSEKVEVGSKLVGESGETLNAIVISVRKVSDIIAEIATTAIEQSAGIEQVNKAIAELDTVTQQNAALVEEAAASSEAMDEQSFELKELVSFFNVGDVHQGRGMPQRSSPAPARSSRQAPPSRASAIQSRPKVSIKAAAPARPVRKQANTSEDWQDF